MNEIDIKVGYKLRVRPESDPSIGNLGRVGRVSGSERAGAWLTFTSSPHAASLFYPWSDLETPPVTSGTRVPKLNERAKVTNERSPFFGQEGDVIDVDQQLHNVTLRMHPNVGTNVFGFGDVENLTDYVLNGPPVAYVPRCDDEVELVGGVLKGFAAKVTFVDHPLREVNLIPLDEPMADSSVYGWSDIKPLDTDPLKFVMTADDRIDEGDLVCEDDVSFMEQAGLDTDDPTVKDSNPKDAIGCSKPSTHFIPKPVLYEVGNVLFSGARKYGAFNWRIAGVRASVYQNAAGRHTDAWQEGQDLDPDSGIHHLSHAIAGLMIIRDAMIQDKFVDDRPPSSPKNWMKKAQAQTDAIIERQPNAVDPYTQIRKAAGDYDSLL